MARTQHATIFVPDGKLKHFFNRFEKYSLETPKKKGERRYEDMLDRIASLRLATLEQLISLPDLLEVNRVLMDRSPIPELGGVIREQQNWIGGSFYNPCSAAMR